MYAFSDVEDFDDESSSFSCYLCDAGFKLLDDNLVYLVLVRLAIYKHKLKSGPSPN